MNFRLSFILSMLLFFFASVSYAQGEGAACCVNPGDILEISVSVYNKPDFERIVEVSEKGKIDCPFIGEIRTAGLSLKEIEEKVKTYLRQDDLAEPRVKVVAKEYGKISLKKIKQRAEKEERLNKIKVFLDNFYPYLKVEESFNDNIFKVNTGEEADCITTLTPGLKYKGKLGAENTQVSLDCGIQFENYAKNDKYNTKNPYLNFSLDHGLGKLRFNLKADLKKNNTSRSSLESSNERDIIDYWTNSYGAGLSMDLNRFVWELLYNNSAQAYKDEEFKLSNNYSKNMFGLIGSVKILPKTYFLLEYEKGEVNYSKSGGNDSESDEYWVGLRGDILAKLKGLVKFGYETKDYESGETANNTRTSVQVDYKISPRLNYHLDWDREIGESDMVGTRLKSKDAVSFTSSYSPRFSKKLLLELKLGYQSLDYEPELEEDIYNLSLLAEYKLKKWVKVGGEYQFEKKYSDNEAGNYNNNIMSLKLTLEF